MTVAQRIQIVKKRYCAYSDFSFKLVGRVICNNPSDNGFIISVTPEKYDHGEEEENYNR